MPLFELKRVLLVHCSYLGVTRGEQNLTPVLTFPILLDAAVKIRSPLIKRG